MKSQVVKYLFAAALSASSVQGFAALSLPVFQGRGSSTEDVIAIVHDASPALSVKISWSSEDPGVYTITQFGDGSEMPRGATPPPTSGTGTTALNEAIQGFRNTYGASATITVSYHEVRKADGTTELSWSISVGVSAADQAVGSMSEAIGKSHK